MCGAVVDLKLNECYETSVVGVNKHFIVVSGEHPTNVYVFNRTDHKLEVR